MNTTYSYYVVAEYDDCEIETKTNSVNIACGEFYRYYMDCKAVHILDGYTGEVLADWHAGDKMYVCDLWKYVLTGWVVTNL